MILDLNTYVDSLKDMMVLAHKLDSSDNYRDLGTLKKDIDFVFNQLTAVGVAEKKVTCLKLDLDLGYYEVIMDSLGDLKN